MAFKKITQEYISRTASVREKLRKDGAKIDLTGKTIKRSENTGVTSGASESSSLVITPGTEKRVERFEKYYENCITTVSLTKLDDTGSGIDLSSPKAAKGTELGSYGLYAVLILILGICLKRYFSERKAEKCTH